MKTGKSAVFKHEVYKHMGLRFRWIFDSFFWSKSFAFQYWGWISAVLISV